LLAKLVAAGTREFRPRVLVTLDAGVLQTQPALVQAIRRYCRLHHEVMELVGDPLILPGGESAKQGWHTVWRLLREIDARGLCRHSYVVAVGGGAHLDVVGLAAALAHRGVRLIRVPTTALAQADSGVGVKNAVNAFGQKNFVGAFAVPAAVVNDLDFLATLPEREKRAAYAEAVKVALIRDAGFFRWLERRAERLAAFETGVFEETVRRCARLHVDHIAEGGDPFESGQARPLDFGHWSAHKLETLTRHRLNHGEAVAIGMALDTVYARLQRLLPASEAERVLTLLKTLGFSLWSPALARREGQGRLRVLGGLEDFRRHLGGGLTVPMIRRIGHAVSVNQIDARVVTQAVAEMRERFG
jgi:3-dehydroquinate synthase